MSLGITTRDPLSTNLSSQKIEEELQSIARIVDALADVRTTYGFERKKTETDQVLLALEPCGHHFEYIKEKEAEHCEFQLNGYWYEPWQICIWCGYINFHQIVNDKEMLRRKGILEVPQ